MHGARFWRSPREFTRHEAASAVPASRERPWAWYGTFLIGVALARAVQLWIRPWAYQHHFPGGSILGWAPSFLAAFAFVCLFAASSEPGSGSLRWWSLWVLLFQFLHELEQAGRAGHYFDWNDVVAIIVGVLLAFVLAGGFTRPRRGPYPVLGSPWG